MDGPLQQPQYVKYNTSAATCQLHKSAEDPRLFKINDGSVICLWNQDPPGFVPKYYGDRKRMQYFARVNGLQLEGGSGSQPMQAVLPCMGDKLEKNWMPFSLPKELGSDGEGHDYIIHSLEPLTIYKFNWNTGQVAQTEEEYVVKDTKAFQLYRKFFNKEKAWFSGTSPGVFYQAFGEFVEWLFVGHIYVHQSSSTTGYANMPRKVNAWSNWHNGYAKQYVAFYFTVTLNKKTCQFFIDRVSRGLGMPSSRFKPTKIIFPSGLCQISPDKFCVTYGEGDCYCHKYVVTKAQLEHVLQKSGTFGKDENHLFLRGAYVPYNDLQWKPDAAVSFHLVMKPTDLVVEVQAQGKDAGTPLTVRKIRMGEDASAHQAFHFKNPSGQKFSQTTFQVAPAHTGPQGGNKLVSYDSGGVKLANQGWMGGTKFYFLPQDDGSVRIKSATEELYVTAEPKELGKVSMSKLIVPETHENFQKFWLVPFEEYYNDELR